MVTVNLINEIEIAFEQESYSFDLAEETTPVSLGKVKVSKAPDLANVTYHLFAGIVDPKLTVAPDGSLIIDGQIYIGPLTVDSGGYAEIIHKGAAFDFETAQTTSFTMSVLAISGSDSVSAPITVNIVDVAEPEFNDPDGDFTLAENDNGSVTADTAGQPYCQ